MPICGWSRSRIHSASLYPGSADLVPSTTVSQRIFISRATGSISGVPRSHLPGKSPDRAIEIAERTGVKLKIAARVDEVDQAYFEREIKALLEHSSSVEFIGEINEQEEDEFLGNALALLFPIDWPEPFGLVWIEALACGTPIIAFRNGSVPEIVEHGRTGFIVDTPEEAAMAVQKIDSIDRETCRAVFEEIFTAHRMARDYLAIYEKIEFDKAGEPNTRTQRFRRAA